MDKWTLLRAVEKAREPLGLRATTLAVLRAMLTFMREDRISATADDRHICFASNAALAERAHISVQTVERHVARLVSLGLVRRHASGNNKRWARRDRQGRVVLAAGLSVLPLLEKHDELRIIAEDHANRLDRLALLRDHCVLALARLKALINSTSGIIETAARLLRRKLEEPELTSLLSEIESHLPSTSNEDTAQMRGTDTADEGHKETPLNPSTDHSDETSRPISDREMTNAFPHLCAELRYASSPAECQSRMDHIANCLGLGTAWTRARELGPATAFMLLGYLLERQDKLRSPRRYAIRLIEDLGQKIITQRALLLSSQREKVSTVY